MHYLQRTYAPDYVAFAFLLTGYILVSSDLASSPAVCLTYATGPTIHGTLPPNVLTLKPEYPIPSCASGAGINGLEYRICRCYTVGDFNPMACYFKSGNTPIPCHSSWILHCVCTCLFFGVC